MIFKVNIGTLTNTVTGYDNTFEILSEQNNKVNSSIKELTDLGWSGTARDEFLKAHEIRQKKYIEFERKIKFVRDILQDIEKTKAVELKTLCENFVNHIERIGQGGALTGADVGVISFNGGTTPINRNIDNCINDDYNKISSNMNKIMNIVDSLEYTSFGIGTQISSAVETSIKNQTTSLTDFNDVFNTYYNRVGDLESSICSAFQQVSEVNEGSFKSSSAISPSGDIATAENANLLTVESNGDVKFNDSDQTFWYLNENATDEEMKLALIDHGYTEDRVDQIFNQGTLRMAYYDWINNHNIELNLDEAQYAYLYMHNTYGTQWMFHQKTLNGDDVKEIENKIFKMVYHREPKYYSWVDGNWKEDTSGTNNSFSEVDAIIGIEDVPPSLEELVTGGIFAATMLTGAGEAELLAAGIEQFGWKAGVWLYTSGALPMTLNTLNGATGAELTAEQQIIQEETAKLETAQSEAEIAAIKEEMQTKIEAAKAEINAASEAQVATNEVNIAETEAQAIEKSAIEAEYKTVDDLKYEQYLEDSAKGKYDIPYGMTEEEYSQYLKGIEKVNDDIAISKVDYDEILKIRNEGTGEIPEVVSETVSVNANEIRFSQSSVNGADEIIDSMKANGWNGDPIDVVRMEDGGLTTIDNTRVVAARAAGIDVQANIHAADEPLPENLIDRFTTKKGVPATWGEAIELRVGKQKASFRNNNPLGADIMERIGN